MCDYNSIDLVGITWAPTFLIIPKISDASNSILIGRAMTGTKVAFVDGCPPYRLRYYTSRDEYTFLALSGATTNAK